MIDRLPAAFVKRMRALMRDEADAFLDSFASPPQLGLRVNTLKTSPSAFRNLSSLGLEPVPWCGEGFLVTDAARERPGLHPHHAAGLYYLQDPSAMAAVVLLDPQPGEHVLDVCAAPGGKATQMAARMNNEGLVVANEVVRSRANALITNLEVSGATRILVVNESADSLASAWPEVFDRVLVDAPCSGEGLFRKNPAACLEWTPASATGCAVRQDAILDAGATVVRRGGRLVYATCTFAPEENEAVVARFLHAHADFRLVDQPALPGSSPGRPDWIDPQLARGLSLECCVRFWPDRAPGEGHFVAVLEREGNAPLRAFPAHRGTLPPEAARSVGEFWRGALTRQAPDIGWQMVGDAVHWMPVAQDMWRGLRVARAGWRIGGISRGRLDPAHALAMALRSEDAQRVVDVDAGAPGPAAYLRGHTFLKPGADGWALITCEGFALGWGKRVHGVVKNHYPRHLRWHDRPRRTE